MSDVPGTGAEKGELIFFPGVNPEDLYHTYDTKYAEAQAPHLVETCLRLGMHPEFADPLQQHLQDLHLVFHGSRHTRDFGEPARSRLTVERVSPAPCEEKAEGGFDESEWKRLLILEGAEFDLLANYVLNAIRRVDGSRSEVPRSLADVVAIDWVFGEETISALSNVYHMQTAYGRYIPDFNGQSPNYYTERSLSANWLLKNNNEGQTAEQDYARLKAGFGLLILQESLLAREVVSGPVQAAWVTNALRNFDPLLHTEQPFPYEPEEVAARINAAVPDTEVTKRYNDFFVLFVGDDESEELDTED